MSPAGTSSFGGVTTIVRRAQRAHSATGGNTPELQLGFEWTSRITCATSVVNEHEVPT